MVQRSLNYGRGLHQVNDLAELGECDLDTAEFKRELLAVFRAPDYAPPLLPAVALELLTLTRKPNANAQQVVELLGHDPLLAGQVLKLAQSAMYSRGAPLRSLEEAVVRLGLTRVSDLFLRVSLETKVFRAPGFAEPMDQLRRHSVFTAEASRIISRSTSGLDGYAFLCGLLHDVGIAVSILALSGQLRAFAPSGFHRAWPCVRDVHESCSELVSSLWGLPPDVALVLRLHHDPSVEGRVHPLAAAVRMADAFAQECGFGFMTDGDDIGVDRAAQQLGLSGQVLVHLLASLRELAERMK